MNGNNEERVVRMLQRAPIRSVATTIGYIATRTGLSYSTSRRILLNLRDQGRVLGACGNPNRGRPSIIWRLAAETFGERVA